MKIPHGPYAKMDEFIHSDWRERLKDQFTQKYWADLIGKLNAAENKGATIYPQKSQIFNALNLCLPSKVKVVIIGQDPYHGKDQATGLAFSSSSIPPSLQNIFKELKHSSSRLYKVAPPMRRNRI